MMPVAVSCVRWLVTLERSVGRPSTLNGPITWPLFVTLRPLVRIPMEAEMLPPRFAAVAPAAAAAADTEAMFCALRLPEEVAACWVIPAMLGMAMAAITAITAITTSNSTKLKAD